VNSLGQHSLDNQALAFLVAALDAGTEDGVRSMLSLGTNGREETSPGL
jgi:hypothetical protein